MVCKVQERRIRSYLGETPLLNGPDLDDAMDQPLALKCESLQRTGSFKARGALNWLLTASKDELKSGLVTVSAGNHAIALAWAAAMQDVATADRVRKVLPLTYRKGRARPRLTVTLKDEDFELLARKYELDPQDRAAIRQRVAEELQGFARQYLTASDQ